MVKQEEIRESVKEIVLAIYHAGSIGTSIGDVVEVSTSELLKKLDSQGVVIRVERKLPYKWKVIKRKHSYNPYNEFTTYALLSRYDKMFGYIQQYQSLTGYKCFERKDYTIYLGNAEWAHSWKSAPTLKKAKDMLIEEFLDSKDNPDNEIPAGYVAVEPLREDNNG